MILYIFLLANLIGALWPFACATSLWSCFPKSRSFPPHSSFLLNYLLVSFFVSFEFWLCKDLASQTWTRAQPGHDRPPWHFIEGQHNNWWWWVMMSAKTIWWKLWKEENIFLLRDNITSDGMGWDWIYCGCDVAYDDKLRWVTVEKQ